MIPDGVYFAETERERQAIETLRFQRLVRDRKLHFPTSDYQEERLSIPGDLYARQIYIQSEQMVVASSRVCHRALGNYTSLQMEIFRPAALFSEYAIEEIAIQDMVIVQRALESQRNELLIRMFRFALQYIAQLGLAVLLTTCRESEFSFYQQLGFCTYTDNHFSLERGLIIPLRLNLSDIEYLNAQSSPLLGAYQPLLHSTKRNLAQAS